MLPRLEELLLDQWSDLPIERKRPDRLEFLGLRTGFDEDCAHFLAFGDGERQPWLMIKTPRGKAAEADLRHETQILNHFRGRKTFRLNETLPQPILAEDIGSLYMLVTTAPSGQPMSMRKSCTDEFKKVCGWLIELFHETCTPEPIEGTRQKLNLIFEQLSSTFDQLSDPELKVLESWIIQVLQAMENGQFSHCAVHGSLNKQYIWSQDSRLNVMNWERSDLFGLPLDDMFRFATTWRFPVLKRGSVERYLQVFKETYLSEGDYSKSVSSLIRSYCQELNIPTETMLPRFGIFLARSAIAERDQLLVAAENGFLPLLYNAESERKQPYKKAINNQLWINLLRLLIEKRNCFRPAISTNF